MSPNALARLAGILTLGLVFIGPIGLVVVPAAVHIPGDPAATQAAIEASPGLFRLGLAAEAAVVAIEVGLTATLWQLFRPVSAWTSASAALARGVMTTMQATGLAVGVTVLLSSATLPPELTQAGMDLRHAIVLTWQVVFALHCALLGVLAWRATFLPKVLGALMIVAGVGYLQATVGEVFLPEWAGVTGAIVGVTAIGGELPLFLWLLVRGARRAHLHTPDRSQVNEASSP